MKTRIIYLIVAIITQLFGCNFTKSKVISQNSSSDSSLGLTKSSLIGWQLIKSSILKTCLNCHSSHTSPELSEINSVRVNIANIISEVNGNDMPPSNSGFGFLSDCQKEILTTWSSANTPENSDLKIGTLANCKNLPDDGNPQAELPLEQMPLTYQTLIDRIIQPRCLKCHNPNSDDLEAAGILFYPYEQIVSRVNLWEAPGYQSKVVEVLSKTDEERMPPPEDSIPLSAEEISFFTRWIDAGKPQ